MDVELHPSVYTVVKILPMEWRTAIFLPWSGGGKDEAVGRAVATGVLVCEVDGGNQPVRSCKKMAQAPTPCSRKRKNTHPAGSIRAKA